MSSTIPDKAIEMPPTFVSHASDVLADTNLGLNGPQIVKVLAGHSVEWDVSIAHPSYPFDALRGSHSKWAIRTQA